MANSLEIRVPFLDADFADLVLQLGPSARVPSDPAKKVFVDAMADWLPRDVTHRPKQGFTFPFVRWVQRELSGDVEKGLRALSTDLGIVKKEPVEELWTRFRARPAQVGWSRPWVLYVLSQYLQKHGLSLPQEVAR
jgi:asparagine synthase (glutamine-hydrolysing)